MRALTTYDFPGRGLTLDVDPGTGTPEPVVTVATHLPSEPLTSLTLANGTSEARRFDPRYQPTAILLDVPTPHRFDNTTDPVGNVTEICETSGCLDDDLVLEGQTVSTMETFETCAGIEAGSGFTVGASGDVPFRAGTGVNLGNGFSVEQGAGFETGVDPALAPEVVNRSYAYQDVHYFLTGADGPWGALAWSYDRIGNRLTETRDGLTETYSYASSPSGGNSPTLTEITLETGGNRTYTHGPAGHLEEVAAGANVVDLSYDDAGRLAGSSGSGETAGFQYDGRSFLERVEDPDAGAFVESAYSSDGLLHALRRQPSATEPEERVTVFYLAGRPVAQLEQVDGTDSWLYLTTDHLGTPLVATDGAGGQVWSGGFEPFGRDFREGMTSGASGKGIFAHLPGQWRDAAWTGATIGVLPFHSVHHWYLAEIGRYSRPDPVGFSKLDPHPCLYVRANPLVSSYPLGLRSWPFGAAKFCRGKSCHCPVPVMVLGEDSSSFTPLPGAGQCVDEDAAYSVECVLKIPDNFRCAMECDPSGGGKVVCDTDIPILGALAEVLLGKKPECFENPEELPRGWPPNPLWSGGR